MSAKLYTFIITIKTRSGVVILQIKATTFRSAISETVIFHRYPEKSIRQIKRK